MNNRGFGILWVFGFVILMGVSLFALYLFLVNFLSPFFSNNHIEPNYKNVYTVYMKEHNIVLEK